MVEIKDKSGHMLYVWNCNNLKDANFKLPFDCLKGADFSNQDLSNADLSVLNLQNADFSGANLKGTCFRKCNLTGAVFTNATGIPKAPKIKNLYTKVCDLQTRLLPYCDSNFLFKSFFRFCIIKVAGKKGKVMEAIYGPSFAAALICIACYPDQPIPDFNEFNEDVIANMKLLVNLETI